MKILFAVDLSEPRSVTDWVADFADRLGASLYVLHVFVPTPASPLPVDPMTGFGDLAYAVYDPSTQASIEMAERTVFERFILERFASPVRPGLLQGDPARTILDDAETLGADLIILGKRHHGTLERFLLGSVSETVMHHADRPVLVVPVADEDPD